MAPKAPRFVDGEKVLCFHGPLLYEAKCLRALMKDKQMNYFIHYSGWNKNWDEWVPDWRVLKHNDANLQKQKNLQKTYLKEKKRKVEKKSSVKKEQETEKGQTSSEEKVTKPVRRKVEEPPEKPVETLKKKKPSEPTYVEEPEVEVSVKIELPSLLNTWLIDDSDLINRQQKILRLPARVTVDHVIASYIKEKVSVKGIPLPVEKTIVRIANKIRDCFNVLLGKLLLYKFERIQYVEMLKEYSGRNMCELYGAIHLTRLFSKFGMLLTEVAAKEKGIPRLVVHLEDFAKYMSTNPSFFSVKDYIFASVDYHRSTLN